MAVANKSKTALGGILVGLSIITLYAESIMPTAKLSLYALSSFYVAIMIVEGGIRLGWIFYITSSLLAVIIIPDKIGLIPYFVFFGIYGIIKFYIEKISKSWLEYALKFIFFNICLGTAIFIIKELLAVDISEYFSIWIIAVIMQIIFIIYDSIFTLSIEYYIKRFRRPLP